MRIRAQIPKRPTHFIIPQLRGRARKNTSENKIYKYNKNYAYSSGCESTCEIINKIHKNSIILHGETDNSEKNTKKININLIN